MQNTSNNDMNKDNTAEDAQHTCVCVYIRLKYAIKNNRICSIPLLVPEVMGEKKGYAQIKQKCIAKCALFQNRKNLVQKKSTCHWVYRKIF